MEIRLARHGRHVAIVTIDNQQRLNAMTRQMLDELGRLWDELERDECRCIILTGAGERAFTVGADISGDLSAVPEIARMVNHALLKNDTYSKPIIAAVNGDCVGGGLELMLSTDIRAAVWQAAWHLSGSPAPRPRWLAPWENWMLWMPKGDRDSVRFRLNSLYRELVMWVFAQSGDERGVRKTGGRWDAKQFQKLSQLQLPKEKVYSTIAELSAWRAQGYDPFVAAIRISKVWETK